MDTNINDLVFINHGAHMDYFLVSTLRSFTFIFDPDVSSLETDILCSLTCNLG